jgi:hypothetical protein
VRKKKEKRENVLDIENICFCNSRIITPNILGERTDSVQFKCSFGEKREN